MTNTFIRAFLQFKQPRLDLVWPFLPFGFGVPLLLVSAHADDIDISACDLETVGAGIESEAKNVIV